MTLIQRPLNVDATSWRGIDVEPTLYKLHVPAGICASFRWIGNIYSSYKANCDFVLQELSLLLPAVILRGKSSAIFLQGR